MSFKSSVSLVVFCVVLLCCSCDKEDSDKKKTFKATNEWQTIEEGVILPSGLHYRMNLATGKKEAKLIDFNNNEQGDTSLTFDKDKQPDSVSENVAESIRKIDDEINLNPELRTLDMASEDSLKSLIKKDKRDEFRNYEELKSIFEEMNMTVDTDVDIMNRLFEKLANPTEEEEEVVANVLRDLEYLVSQIDNARHFVSQNGITKIILPCLNSSSFEIRTETLKLVGSAVQNNIPVQIKCLEHNILQPILHLFNQHVISKEHIKTGNELDHVYRLKSAAVYAISCLIRNFPTAQNDVIKNGGLNILLNEKIFMDNSENGYKLQLKIASLLNTLLQERYDAQIQLNILQSKLDELPGSGGSSEYELNLTRSKYKEAQSKVDQFKEQDLAASLRSLHWCPLVRNLFVKNNYKSNMETITSVLLTSLDLCERFGRDRQMRNVLIQMEASFGAYDEQSALNLRQLYDVLVKEGGETREGEGEDRDEEGETREGEGEKRDDEGETREREGETRDGEREMRVDREEEGEKRKEKDEL